MSDRPRAKYVVVTAITPTPLGEGKTTTTVGLGQAFQHIGRSATIAIRQPSMGPTFGIKGGAAGGGYSQVVPMELFNLHLSGDMHAVTAAHNMCAAMLDAHLFHGNELASICTTSPGVGCSMSTIERCATSRSGWVGASMAFPARPASTSPRPPRSWPRLRLATSLQDLRERLGRIVVGYTKSGTPVTTEELGVAGSMAVILMEAIKPNLMQTLEGTPALVHTGPFGNIATGNSSIVADRIGIHTGDFLLTEAGFGADMGAERFFNIKCRYSGIAPDAAVLVATVRGLKAHSGNHKIVAGKPLPEAILAENPDEVHAGGDNLRKQLENMQIHGVTPVVAINVFPEDHDADIAAISEIAEEYGARSAVTTHFADGGRVRNELAPRSPRPARRESHFEVLYPTTHRSRTRSTLSPPRSMAPTMSSTRRRPTSSSPPTKTPGSAPAGLHREDPSVDLVGPEAQGRADRLDACRCARSELRWARASSIRSAATCARCPVLARTPAAMNIDLDENGEIVGLS